MSHGEGRPEPGFRLSNTGRAQGGDGADVNSGLQIKDSRNVNINSPIYNSFFDPQYAPLASRIISYGELIAERTNGFVGRRFATDAVDAFLRDRRSGYLVIEGEPGIGKTTLLAQLVKTRAYPHHFVVATQGVTRAEQFLANMCAQLIATYRLDQQNWLPPEATRDGAYLSELLRLAAQSRSTDTPGGQNIVLVVDALDEAEAAADVRANVLYLPKHLPEGVFFIVSSRTRDRTDLRLQADSLGYFTLDSRSDANLADISLYVEAFAARPALRARLTDLGLTVPAFVSALVDKAEGNFMYLHHVLPAIEEGRLGGGGLDELPAGLRAYYDAHWRQMKAEGGEEWFTFRQPVIVYLAAAKKPVSARQLATMSRIPFPRVADTLRLWREFIQIETVAGMPRYRIYHMSFQDFLRSKEEVQEEVREMDLKQAHSRIADHLMARHLPDGRR
ncbi:ATP-binding protein [Streptomyces sp. SD31]|uniref:ATP-binding protein n=1 Tax=Streptomyces sp. SD31 TaxID=3452208 RepID=UPI003F897F6B